VRATFYSLAIWTKTYILPFTRYSRLLSRFSLSWWGASIEHVILEKTSNAKFGKKKVGTLSYFPLADSKVPSSAVLEVFTSILPIFRFRISGNHFKPQDLRVGWIDLYQNWWKRQPSHLCRSGLFWCSDKLHCFRIVAVQVGLRSIKTGQNGPKLSIFGPQANFRAHICQISKRNLKIAASSDRMTQEQWRSVQRVQKYRLAKSKNNNNVTAVKQLLLRSCVG